MQCGCRNLWFNRTLYSNITPEQQVFRLEKITFGKKITAGLAIISNLTILFEPKNISCPFGLVGDVVD
jgi:hypothetical protein